MTEPTHETVEEVRTIKDAIGWSWLQLAQRLHWKPADAHQFQRLRFAIKTHHLEWLRDVRNAFESVPFPDDPVIIAGEEPKWERQGSPMVDPLPSPVVMREELLPMSADGSVNVMLVEDIAQKIASEYLGIAATEMSPDERRGALWALGRMAEQFNVAARVRDFIKPPAPEPQKQPYQEAQGGILRSAVTLGSGLAVHRQAAAETGQRTPF